MNADVHLMVSWCSLLTNLPVKVSTDACQIFYCWWLPKGVFSGSFWHIAFICAFIIDVNGHSFSAWFSYFPTFCERILTQTTCLLYRVINHVNRQMFLCIDKKSVDFFRIRGVCGVCWQGFRTPWIATTRGRWQREWLQHPGFYCHACGCYIRSTQSASKFCVISG